MQIIDRYSYCNRLRTVDPAQKAGLAILTLALCLVLDRPAVGLLAVLWMWALACWRAGLPAPLFGRLLLAEGFFLLLAAFGVALTIGNVAPVASLWRAAVGPWWLSFSRASVESSVALATRALGCTAALNFLALTTPLTDLTDLLRRMRVPSLLVELMTLVYRFVFTLLESLVRIRSAQECRLGYSGFRRGTASAAILAGHLFWDAYLRGKRMQVALDSRGYSGELRLLPLTYRGDSELIWLGAGLCATLLLARVLV